MNNHSTFVTTGWVCTCGRARILYAVKPGKRMDCCMYCGCPTTEGISVTVHVARTYRRCGIWPFRWWAPLPGADRVSVTGHGLTKIPEGHVYHRLRADEIEGERKKRSNSGPPFKVFPW